MKGAFNSILIICLLGIAGWLHAQDWDIEAPDYDAIEKSIAEDTSSLFYTKLMQRYLSADASLTLRERRHLYYGFIYHPDYKPYAPSRFIDSLNQILESDTLLVNHYSDIVQYSDSVLADDPFNLKVLNYKYFIYDITGAKEAFDSNLIKMKVIIDAITSTGDGLSKHSAFYVIDPGHEYDILNMLGFESAGEQSLIDHYDYLKLKDNEYGLEGMYFDITPCLKQLDILLKD